MGECIFTVFSLLLILLVVLLLVLRLVLLLLRSLCLLQDVPDPWEPAALAVLRSVAMPQAQDQTLPRHPRKCPPLFPSRPITTRLTRSSLWLVVRRRRQEVLHHGWRPDAVHRPAAAGGVSPDQQGDPAREPEAPLCLRSTVKVVWLCLPQQLHWSRSLRRWKLFNYSKTPAASCTFTINPLPKTPEHLDYLFPVFGSQQLWKLNSPRRKQLSCSVHVHFISERHCRGVSDKCWAAGGAVGLTQFRATMDACVWPK